jgi:hypothetical protein
VSAADGRRLRPWDVAVADRVRELRFLYVGVGAGATDPAVRAWSDGLGAAPTPT